MLLTICSNFLCFPPRSHSTWKTLSFLLWWVKGKTEGRRNYMSSNPVLKNLDPDSVHDKKSNQAVREQHIILKDCTIQTSSIDAFFKWPLNKVHTADQNSLSVMHWESLPVYKTRHNHFSLYCSQFHVTLKSETLEKWKLKKKNKSHSTRQFPLFNQ